MDLNLSGFDESSKVDEVIARAREIAEILKKWIEEEGFELGAPVKMMPNGS